VRRGPLSRAAGTLTILRSWPGQRRAHFAPRELLIARRDRRVRDSVLYAAEHVPHYRDLLRREGIDPRELTTAEDLSLLPPLHRENVRADLERFRSTAPAARDGIMLRSSGTTGEPLDVFHDRASVLANVSYSERERAIETALVGKRFGYTRVYLGTPGPENVQRVRGLMDTASYRPLRPRFRMVLSTQPYERIVEQIDALRPDVLSGSGSFLEAFFRTAAARGGPSHRPRALLYSWDHMTEDGRRLIERSFGVRVMSRYSAMESLKIAFHCEEGRFHLHEDLCHVTIAGLDDEKLRNGERGEIVLSNLVNRGTVLLNYRLGDLGAVSSERCACGRGTKLLTQFEGRVSEVIRLPDGSLVDPLALSVAVRLPGVVRHQLVEIRPGELLLRVATADETAYERVAPDLRATLRDVLHGLEVDVTYAADIAPEPGKKFRPIVLLG
jgi:phenylacetate-CoA ligase